MRRFAVLLTLSLGLTVPRESLAHHYWEVSAGIGAAATTPLSIADGAGRAGPSMNPAFLVEAGYRTDCDAFASLAFTHQELTVGYRAKGDEVDSGSLGVSRSDLGIGGYLEKTWWRWVPYLGAQVGVTRFAAAGFEDEYRPMMVFDGGVKYDLSEHFQIRLFARSPMTLMTATTKILCVSPVGCEEDTNGTPIFQLQGGLGLTVEF